MIKSAPLLAFIALFLFSLTLPAETGSIHGSVTLPTKDPIKRMSARYRDTDARILGAPAPMIAVVYLSNAQTATQAQPTDTPAILAQKGLQFFPRILPITVGSSVAFPNHDDTFHNVFSYSPTKKFDLGRYKKSEEAPVRSFDTAGVVSIFCEVHRHMRANILVLDTPYFVSTEADGNFRLEGIPAGDYQATAWISPNEQVVKAVSITSGGQTRIDF